MDKNQFVEPVEKEVVEDSYEKQLERKREYNRQWYANNRERRNQYLKEYRKKQKAELEELRKLAATVGAM